MKKFLSILVLSLVTIPAFSERVGNIEFDFPPSQHPWEALFDQNGFVCEGEDFGDDHMKVFMHREGDALEVFAIVSTSDEDADEEEEIDTAESIEREINEMICGFLPNHRFQIHTYVEIDASHDGFLDWEFRDHTIDLMHGLTRAINVDGKIHMIGYFTTAEKTEQNHALWTGVLNSAHIVAQ